MNKRKGPPARKTTRPDPVSKLKAADAMDAMAGLEDTDTATNPRTRKARSVPSRETAEAEAWTVERSIDRLAGIACSLVGGLDLRAVFKAILDSAVGMVGAERAVLFIGRGEDTPLVPVLAVGIGGEELETIERVSRTVLEHARSRELFITRDALSDPLMRDIPSVHTKQVRAVACARLSVRGEPVGILYLDAPSAGDGFAAEAERILSGFATIAGAALQHSRVQDELRLANERLANRLGVQDRFWALPTSSPAMRGLKEKIAVAAQIEVPVLLVGEPGTEVEVVAREIHAAGRRSMRSFGFYNCAIGPRNLLDAALFGEPTGTSAPAAASDIGLIRRADQGVVFLNEVQCVDRGVQAKLLRLLDEQVVQPVRSRQMFPADVQLITATSVDLRSEVRAGRFDRDLYYRLSAFQVVVPPLREHPDDVPALVQHFINRHQAEFPRLEVAFDGHAFKEFERYAWPGNMAELEWLVERAMARTIDGHVDSVLVHELMSASAGDERKAESEPLPLAQGLDATASIRRLAEVERDAIRDALIRTRGNRSKTARLLGIQRNTLLRKIDGLGVPLQGIPNRRGRK